MGNLLHGTAYKRYAARHIMKLGYVSTIRRGNGDSTTLLRGTSTTVLSSGAFQISDAAGQERSNTRLRVTRLGALDAAAIRG
jgi:hypothetical protein